MAKDFFSGMKEWEDVEPHDQAAENIKAASVSERDPNTEGSIRDTSKELGYEAATLRGQSKLAIERAKQQKRIDGLKSKKETADWLAESPDNALLSMDDIDQVDRLIRVAKSIPMRSDEEQFGFGERIGASIGDFGEGIVNGVGGLMSSIYGGMRFVLEADAKIARTVGLDGLAEYLESGVGFTERGADMAKELAPTLVANAFGGSVEDFDTANRISNRMNRARFDIYGISTGDIAGAGVSLVPTMLGGLAVQGLSTANKFRAFGAIAGTQQASSEFARQRGEGKEFGEAAQISAMSGMITGLLTRVIPAGPENALDDLAKKLSTANSPKELLRANLARATSVQFASEFLEEGLDETLQALLVDGTSWEEAIDRGLKAGAIGGILGGGIGLSTEIFAARQQSARTALGFRDGLESVAAELDQSLTAGRSSDAAKELMQSHGGLNKTAYLDGLAAQEIAKTKEGQETLYKAGITASDISTAVNGNDVIEVDTATVMAVSKGGVRSSILDNLRQEPDAPNSIEAELQTGESNIAARLAQQDETHELRNATAINAEATRIRDEIIKTSGVSKGEAAAQVEQLVTSARTMFNRNPDAFRSPEELLGRIRVQSGEDVPRGTLKQSGVRVSDEDQMFLDELADNGAQIDNGLVTLYHRTDAASKQQIEKTGKIIGKEDGIFFTTKASDSQADGFGDAVVAVQLPVSSVVLDDVFGDEAHVKIPARIGQAIDIRQGLGSFNQSTIGQQELGDTFDSRQEFYQAAFHGTPHKVDKFLLDNIGTGEGAQAFGWGLYFTSEERIAEWYRDKLENTIPPRSEYGVHRLIELGGDWTDSEVVEAVARHKGVLTKEELVSKYSEIEGDLDSDATIVVDVFKRNNPRGIEWMSGDLKTVDIPESEDLLQYDQPFNRQPHHIQAELLDWSDENEIRLDMGTGQDVYERIEKYWKDLGSDRPDKAASITLQKMGINGLEYPAEGGKSKGRNFVIWDEASIEIIDPDRGPTKEFYQSQANNARGSLQITDDAYIISLFKGQDLSTVLHETGHIFLEEIRQAISTGNASDQLMKDWIATVRWQSKNKDMHLKYLREELRKSKRSDDATRTDRLTQTIEWLKDASESELQVHASTFAHELPEAVGYGYAESMHELWARGYESYLSEGKAPSLGLEKAFSRFSQWIAGVYSKVKNSFNAEHDLDVILNDEVRQVFDRILATDTEIKELMLFNQYTNRGDAELGDIAGFNPESTGKINSLFRESQNEIRNAMLKGRAKVAKERKKEFRSGVNELPVYQAWEQIKQQGGLRLVTVRTEFGQDTVNALRKKGLMAKGEESGASADAVATRNGYETAEDMILELMDAKPAAEQAQLELERAVLDDEISVPTMEHVLDSPSYDKAINELALGLDRALRGGVPIEERRILKQIAEREIADMPVYNAVQVNTYLGAMHRHFKDNRVQLTKNQYPEAMKSLQDGIKNMEKGRASRNARDMQNKLIKRIARWKKMDPKSVDYNYYYHAIKLAEFYGLSKKSDIPEPDLSLKATLEEGINAGLVDPTPDYDEWMMFPQGSKRLSELQLSLNAQKPTIPNKRGPRQIFQVMQAKELARIDEFLELLIIRGKNKAEPTIDTTGELLSDWYEDFIRTTGELDDNGIPRFDKDSFAQKISNIYNEVLDSAATPDHYYRTLDGQSGQFKDFDITKPLARLAMRGSAEAINKQEALKERVYAELKPHFQVIGAGLKRLRAEHGNSVTIEGVPVPQKAKDAGVKTWRPDRLLEVVFNLGNDYNADATASGFGWVQTKVNEDGSTELVPDRAPMMKIAALFTKAELRAVQSVWDGLNTLWPESRRVHMQLYGKPPTKVDGDPIELQALDGPIKLAGGYFMLSFDKDDVSSNQMAQDSVQNLGMNYQDTFAPSKMTLSALKGRTHSGDKLINLNPLEVINKHIHSTTSFIALAPWLEDMKKVLLYKESASAPNVQNIMRAKIGTSAVKQLMTNMRALAGNEKFDLTWFGKAVQWTRPAVAVFLLGANIRGPVAVMDAIPTLMNDVGPVEYMREMNLFKQEEGVAMYNFILDKSQFMRRRLKGAYDRDVREVFNKEIGFSKLSGFTQARDKIAETSLALYSYPAMAYEMPAWSAVFKKTLEQTGDEDASITAADLAIRSTQPSSDLRDQSMILRNKTGVIAAMTMFTGWAITRLSSNRFALRAVKAKKMSKLRWGTFFFFQNILSAGPFIMLAALSEAFDDDDRRKKKDDTTMFERMAKAGVVDYFHGIPLVSNVVEASYESLIEGKRFDISGVSDAKALGVMARIVGDGMNGMYDAFSEEDPDKRQAAMWDVAHLISFSLKIPVTRVMEKMTEQLERLDK